MEVCKECEKKICLAREKRTAGCEEIKLPLTTVGSFSQRKLLGFPLFDPPPSQTPVLFQTWRSPPLQLLYKGSNPLRREEEGIPALSKNILKVEKRPLWIGGYTLLPLPKSSSQPPYSLILPRSFEKKKF